jgi:hypothetical protein
VSGRDLSKILVEDGSFFYSLAYAGGAVQPDPESNDKVIKRVTSSKDFGYNIAAIKTFSSIRFNLQLLINLVSNTGLVPNGVFDMYGDRRSQRFNLEEAEGTDTDDAMDGVYSIIKLVIDENISNRKMVDPSISFPDGSLLGQVNKICQEPFVEFLTDTYGDMFHFVARQPPFTQEAMIDVLDSEDKLIIDIEEDNVAQESLRFDDDEVFSWYELEMTAAFTGRTTKNTFAYIHPIYFPEYAAIWGVKRLKVADQYITYHGMRDVDESKHNNYAAKMAAQDMKFMMDTTLHLPFTRKGTITLASGDRRIKRGTFVRYKPTNEIFYVDGVANSYQIGMEGIDRTTVLQVTRGMVEDYIKGKSESIRTDGGYHGKKVSYFNIVDTKEIADKIIAGTEGGVKVESVNPVDPDIFNFFLTRKQLFIDDQKFKV